MNAARGLLGVHVPGRTVWHRLPTSAKYLVFLALTVPAVAVQQPAVAVGTLALSLVLVASTRAPLRLAWGLPWGLVAVLALVAGYHVLTGAPALGLRLVASMLTALYASRIVLVSTPMPVLIDALVALARPLGRLGLDPERFGLAVAVMVRSVPFVAGAFSEVRDAARARGIERNPFLLVTPVVIQTVAYARATGDALAARGLGEASEHR